MEDKSMQYDFKKFSKRGLVYIIVNEMFSAEGYQDRKGAYTDYINMKNLFKPLNFKLITFYDKTAEQIKSILRNASKRRDLAERPCFICIISSHGDQKSEVDPTDNRTLEHVIVGVDGTDVLTKDLVHYFSDDKCPHMKDKPKLFFIQACRKTLDSKDPSKALDAGVPVQYVVSAKVSKHQRLRGKSLTNTKYDGADPKPELSDVLSEEAIIGTDPGEPEYPGDKDKEEDDEFTDGYDTATTDNDSDDDDVDREQGHDEVRSRDRSVFKNPNTPEGDAAPSTRIKHIEAITPDVTPNLGVGSSDQPDTGPKSKLRVDTFTPLAEMEVIAIPCHNDMLIMFASPPGKFAWRNEKKGGWLLVSLYNVLMPYVRSREISDRDFLSLLVEVSQDVSLKETNSKCPQYNALKMAPTIYHRLTKEVVMSLSLPGL